MSCPKCPPGGPVSVGLLNQDGIPLLASPAADNRTPVVALVGNPNVGKSTVFNALTGARQHVGNWPGKTVHVATGEVRCGERQITLVDLPGTYSLNPTSPDEALSRDLLVDADAANRPQLAIVVVDASNLTRNLFLLSAVLDTGIPTIVAITMLDVAAARGITVDPARLSAALGVPVIGANLRASTTARTELLGAIGEALDGAAPSPPTPDYDLGTEVAAIGAALDARPDLVARYPRRWLELAILTNEHEVAELAPVAATARAQLLTRHPQPADETFDAITETRLIVADQRYAWARRIQAEAVKREPPTRRPLSDRFDRLAVSMWFGVPFFLAVIWAVFELTTRLAAPLQDWLDQLISGPVSDGADSLLTSVGIGGVARDFVVDGVISGVGALLTFVPLMIIMFLLLALLEDSGYMARAAFLADRVMRAIGLPGRAFLPLLVGFGCNVPAIGGTRILHNSRHRQLATMLIPYISCSARLTVYVLIAQIFFGSSSGTVIWGLYVGSVLLVVGVGLLLRRTLFRDVSREPLIIELPPYRTPLPRVVGAQVWIELRGFLQTAAKIIVSTVVVVWALSAIPMPGHGGDDPLPPNHSVYGAIASTVSPIFEPAGFGDWHMTGALMTGFVAKEAVVSTIAQTYAADEDAGSLKPHVRATFEESSGGHEGPAALAFLVFMLAYTPCLATVAIQRQMIGTKLTLIGIGLSLVIAWVLATGVFQIGRLFW